MARKPKAQPNPEAAAPVSAPELAAPARRGRKKAAALSFAQPSAANTDKPATDDAGADARKAGPTKAPGRGGPGRKPKQGAGTEAAPSSQGSAAGPKGQTSHQPEAEATPDLIEDGVLTAAADSNPVQPDLDRSGPASEAAQPSPEAGASVPAKPAAHWDRTTDRVQFDWPAIERTAAQDGPNQGMAKLLVAARAEGAQSRWPF